MGKKEALSLLLQGKKDGETREGQVRSEVRGGGVVLSLAKKSLLLSSLYTSNKTNS
jgi:hypothetical protein